MKRFAGAMLTLIALMSFHAPADARWVIGQEPVTWRTTTTTSTSPTFTQAGFIDSLVVREATANENSAQHADTTAAFTPSYLFDPQPNAGTALAVDSTVVFSLWFVPTSRSGMSATADTATVTFQWSPNGTDWYAFIGSKTSAVTMLEYGTSNTFAVNCWQLCAAAGATLGLNQATIAAAANPSVNSNSIMSVQFVRAIITGDWTGEYIGYLRGWKWVRDDWQTQ